METFSMRWQVRHSKVRSSKPLLPGEIRASPILCLQVRHIGRSTLEDEIRIAPHPRKRYAFKHKSVCPVSDIRTKFRRMLSKSCGTATKAWTDCPCRRCLPEIQTSHWGSKRPVPQCRLAGSQPRIKQNGARRRTRLLTRRKFPHGFSARFEMLTSSGHA
jgi:hypothetical protein